MTDTFPAGFLWGAATSPHQTEGNNTTSDLWAIESQPGSPMAEPSGDACDSLHRWPEDLDIVAGLGLNAYRFGIEWARVEPAPGLISKAMLGHYHRIITACLERSIAPVVTLHHFTSPLWFSAAGGWASPQAPDLFGTYARALAPILDGVEWACTMNEPNMIAIMHTARKLPAPAGQPPAGLPEPDPLVSATLARAHRTARDQLSAVTGLKTGWTVANQSVQAIDGAAGRADQWRATREDQFLDSAAGDDFIGVQAYTRTVIGPDGPLPPGEQTRQTLTGWEFYPPALEAAVRHTASRLPGMPILVTENGIATAQDPERLEYTQAALVGLGGAIADGIDVRGYLHWSLLDNYEWGSYRPAFGLVAVDRDTFARTIKPSARWLGCVARANGLPRGSGGA